MVSSTAPACGGEEASASDPRLLLDTGAARLGHPWPGMVLGLRLGAAAMNTLGVARDIDGQLAA